MSSDIPESDWRAFRKLRELALERLCERTLRELERIASANERSFHSRYLGIFELIHERDDQIALVFNNPRRSSAVSQLAGMLSLALITRDDLSNFTPGTQAVVEAVSQATRKGRGTKSGALRE